MGQKRLLLTLMTLSPLIANVMSIPSSPSLNPYLPKDTFFIYDTRFMTPQGSITPSQQPHVVPQRRLRPTSPSSQRPFGSMITPQRQPSTVPQRPRVPANTPQQQTYLAPRRPTAPVVFPQQSPPMHSNTHGVLSPPRQPTRVPQGSGPYQQMDCAAQGGHRFSTSPRPNIQRQIPTAQQSTPQNHQSQSINRQTPTTQENTIMRPTRRHRACGVLPPPGDCRAAFPRYYYNNKTDQCDCFLYGGCGSEGLKYSFQSLEECHLTCLPLKKEEGPSCKEIFHEEEVFFQSSNPAFPWPLPAPSQSSTQPQNTPSHILPTVDTSHIPDRPLIIYLTNSAKGSRHDTDSGE